MFLVGELIFLLVVCLLIDILVNLLRVFLFFLWCNGFYLRGEDLNIDDVGVIGGIVYELYKWYYFFGFFGEYFSVFGEFGKGGKFLWWFRIWRG